MRNNLKSRLRGNFQKFEKKLPLEKFIPAAFIIFLLFLFILSIITYRHVNEYRSDIDWINRTNDVIKKIDNIHLRIIQLPQLRRGYLIARAEDYVSSINVQKEIIKKELLEIKTLTRDNSEQQELINQLDSLFEENNALLNISIRNILNGTDTDTAQIMQTNLIQYNLEKVRDVSTKIKDNEISLLNLRRAEADASNSELRVFIIITSLFSFMIIGLSLLISDKLIKNKSRAEERLKDSYRELEDIVGERTSELSQANEKLKLEISARERFEENLKESESRFRMMADSSPVLMWVSGKGKLYNYFNKVWLNFTGIKFDEALGFGWRKDVHPDDLQRCIESYDNAFDKRELFEIEYRLRTANGNYRWVLDKGVPRYEGEEFVGYIGSCVDINERKLNERFLKIQYSLSKTLAEAKTIEDASKEILENICAGINWDFGILWIADDKKESLSVKSIWSRDVFSSEEYVQYYDRSFVFPKNYGLPGEVWKEKKSKWINDIANDTNFIRKDAAKKAGWQSALGIPIASGDVIIAVIECLSKKRLDEKKELLEVLESAGRQFGNFIERKKAEEKLKDSHSELEEKVKERTNELAEALNRLLKEIEIKEEIQNRIKIFAHTIRSINECVYITDLNNNTIFVNQAFEKIYGYQEEELVGKEIIVLNSANIHVNLRKEIMDKTASGGWKGEIISNRKDGFEFHTFLSTTTVKNEEGRIEAIVGICQDISELKNAEEAIKKRNNILNILNDVIHFTNKTFDVNLAIQYSINKVCQYTNWDVGHCFLVKEGTLNSTKIWNEGLNGKYVPFKELTESIVFKKGEGIPGKAFESEKSTWVKIADLKDEKKLRRAKAIASAELKTGIWISIIFQNKTVGVLEFFKSDDTKPDKEVLECVNNIGIELASLMEKVSTIDKIKENEKLLNEAQHIAKLGSWEWDISKDILIWSDEMYRIFEIEKSGNHFTFKDFLNFVIKEDRNTLEEIIKSMVKNKTPFSYTYRIRTSSDRVKFLNSHTQLNLNSNNEIENVIGITMDITQIREAEEKTKSSSKQLRESQRVSKTGTWETDLQTGVQTWSEEIYSIYGLNPGETEPAYKNIRHLVHPDDLERIDTINNKFETSPGPVSFHYRIFSKDNQLKHLYTEININYDKTGKPVRLFGSVQDLTEVKRIEDELGKTNIKLEEAYKEIVHNEKLSALGRFASGIAHEIRNPLANISSLAQLIEKSHVDEKLSKHLKYILVNTEIANKIIKDLLNFASPEELISQTGSVEEVIENVVESIKPQCTENKIEIVKKVSPGLPQISIDKFKLLAAFMNFTSNSIDAMESGGTLTIQARMDKFNKYIIVDILDTGIGIPEENLDKILEPFFTSKKNGTGLGMGLAYQTIKSHNAVFNIYSNVNKGTHIEIKLPVKEN